MFMVANQKAAEKLFTENVRKKRPNQKVNLNNFMSVPMMKKDGKMVPVKKDKDGKWVPIENAELYYDGEKLLVRAKDHAAQEKKEE